MIQLSELSVTDGKLLFKKYRDGKTQKNRGKKMIQLSELIVAESVLQTTNFFLKSREMQKHKKNR